MIHRGEVGAVYVSPAAMADWSALTVSRDRGDKEALARFRLAWDRWCGDVHARFGADVLRAEAVHKPVTGERLSLFVWKAWGRRAYGFLGRVNGRRAFVIVRFAEKKRERTSSVMLAETARMGVGVMREAA